jgi:hypothetical protein
VVSFLKVPTGVILFVVLLYTNLEGLWLNDWFSYGLYWLMRKCSAMIEVCCFGQSEVEVVELSCGH